MAAGKDTTLDPGAERAIEVAADEMEQAATRVSDGAAHDITEFAIVIYADVFEHAHGNEGVEASANVAVIVFDELDLVGETFALGTLTGESDLLVRDVEGLHVDAIVARHVEGESAPAAPGFDDGFAGLQPDLTANVIEFGQLRGFE
jgi:hypothetical protein